MSAIHYFKIFARRNQSLIPPFTGAEIVNATWKARYCVKWSTNSWQVVYCVYSIAQLVPNWAKQSAWLQCLIVSSAIFLTDSWFFTVYWEYYCFCEVSSKYLLMCKAPSIRKQESNNHVNIEQVPDPVAVPIQMLIILLVFWLTRLIGIWQEDMQARGWQLN